MDSNPCLLSALLVMFFSNLLKGEEVRGCVWVTDDGKGTHVAVPHPERDNAELKAKDDLGLAFSGGGTRAACATLGALRALHELGVLERVRYVSTVSGGSWGVAPWLFLPNADRTADARHLGSVVKPSDLTVEKLNEKAEGSCAAAFAEVRLPSFCGIWKNKLLYGDEAYAQAVGHAFLKPFGLHETRKFVTWNEASRSELIRLNPSLDEDDFLMPAKDRPFWICNVSLTLTTFRRADISEAERENRSNGESTGHRPFFRPFEMTPLYSGAPTLIEPHGWWIKRAPSPWSIGGGYVENLLYDSRKPQECTPRGAGEARVMRASLGLPRILASHRFCLSDMVAASGAAPSAAVDSIVGANPLPAGIAKSLGFPEFRHWSPAKPEPAPGFDLAHDDGGAIDNTGIAALASRGVGRVIAFMSDSMPFGYTSLLSNHHADPAAQVMSAWVSLVFGEKGKHPTGASPHSMQIFQEGKAGLERLREAVREAWLEQRPLIHTETYTTKSNPFLRVTGGRKMRVTWVFLGPAAPWTRLARDVAGRDQFTSNTSWFGQLPAATREHLAHNAEFTRFPHYRIFWENLGSRTDNNDMIGYSTAQANALIHFACHQVMQSARESR
jgi:hypothetical protein